MKQNNVTYTHYKDLHCWSYFQNDHNLFTILPTDIKHNLQRISRQVAVSVRNPQTVSAYHVLLSVSVGPSMSRANSFWCGKSSCSIACTFATSYAYHFKWHRIFFVVVHRIRSSLLICSMDFPGLCCKPYELCPLCSQMSRALCAFLCKTLITRLLKLFLSVLIGLSSIFKALMFPHRSHWSQLPGPQHACSFLVHWWYSTFLFPPFRIVL